MLCEKVVLMYDYKTTEVHTVPELPVSPPLYDAHTHSCMQ